MDQNNMNQQENSVEQQTGQTQNPYMNPMYQQPSYQPPVTSDEVSMGEWMWTILFLCIPIVNFVLLFVWAFSDSTKASKANYCKAQLIWMLIGICLSVLLIILGIFVGFGLAGSYISSVL